MLYHILRREKKNPLKTTVIRSPKGSTRQNKETSKNEIEYNHEEHEKKGMNWK